MHLPDTDTTPPVPMPIPGTYNLESGISYYFTEHGEQLRCLPKYAKDTKIHMIMKLTLGLLHQTMRLVMEMFVHKNYTATSPQNGPIFSSVFLKYMAIVTDSIYLTEQRSDAVHDQSAC